MDGNSTPPVEELCQRFEKLLLEDVLSAGEKEALSAKLLRIIFSDDISGVD